MASFIRASLVLTLVFMAACAGRSPDTDPDPAESAMVRVRNPRHLVRGAGPIRFLADPIGGNRTPVSEEMSVQPGDLVTLTIPSQ